ncbi:MAG TPA: YceI family protein [Streptosporangiaceae bacterium]|nr:YceI family protein [Streptosporangiaceae bacterium]
MTTPTQQTSAALRAQLTDGSLAGSWTLDPARSTAALRSKSMWGLAPVKGVFRDLEGSGTVSAAGEVTGSIALATGSLDTKNTKRDTHLRSADFFLSEKYPAITFSVGTLVPASEGVTISGTLTVRDRSLPISFPATVALASDSEVVLDATVQVDRSEFGLTWNQLGMASMNSTITIHAVFTKS